jgi:hypothetical protein
MVSLSNHQTKGELPTVRWARHLAKYTENPMDDIHPILRYLAGTAVATFTGLAYWFALENMRGYKNKFVFALTASILLSPLGAWFISLFMRLYSLRNRNNSSKTPPRNFNTDET